MRKLSAVLFGLLIALGSLVMTSSPASAQEPTVDVEITPPGDCGETTFTTEWAEGAREVNNTVLVVQVGDEQLVVHIGESVDIGPFDQDAVNLRWRVWGGGERDHDNPPLTDLNALLDYLKVHSDGELHMDPPGVAWHDELLNGCVATSTPTATATASSQPTSSATPSPSDSAASPTPTDPVVAKPAGLPVTGSPLPVFLGTGAALLGLGGGLYLLGRKRRNPTTS